jgi:serine phosphatase RsbU (regulator of sigma subunit)
MRVLVGWDDPSEIELLTMYLEVDDTAVQLVKDARELVHRFRTESYDVVLFPVVYPDSDTAFDAFQQLSRIDPLVPVLMASRPGEIYPLARLIRHGLRAHITRDPQKEYLFLLQTLLESTLAGKHAEEARMLSLRLQEEIEAVRKLQEAIIPKDMSAPPGYSVVARYEPAQIQSRGNKPVVLAGGDYYDAFRVADDTLIFLVGDASGHGMKACMSIMTMHTLISQFKDNIARPPHQFVSQINRQLCAHDMMRKEGGFITLLYGVLHNGVLRWASAGHNSPLLQNLSTGEIFDLGESAEQDGGMPLAVSADEEYRTITSVIPPGHRLMVYTDGIIEAFPELDGEHQEFGLAGVRRTLEDCVRLPITDTLDRLFKVSYEFTRGSGRHDDTSVLLVDRSA